MTNEYRDAELTNARSESAAARQRMDGARTKAAWRKAEENLNFWQGKVAFLSHAR